MFVALRNDKDTQLGVRPGDFSLYEVNEFDEFQGVMLWPENAAPVRVDLPAEVKSTPGWLREAMNQIKE